MVLCKHKFQAAEDYLKKHPDEESDWSSYVVFKTTQPYIFEKFMDNEASFHNVKYNIHESVFYLRGTSEDVDDILNDFIFEVYPDFNYSIVERPLGLEFDPECQQCNYEWRLMNGYVKEIESSGKKTKAMTSQAASAVKLDGHENEDEFANLVLNGKVIKGQGKPDVAAGPNREINISCKKILKKMQVFLFRNFDYVNEFNELAPYLNDCIEALSPTYEEYLQNKKNDKDNKRCAMEALKGVLTDVNNFENFLLSAFFSGHSSQENQHVHLISIKDTDNRHHVYDSYEFIDILSKNLKIFNSDGEFGAQKVTFKAPIGRYNRLVIVGEIEVRADSPQHYRELKFWMAGSLEKNNILTLLSRNIKGYKFINDRLVLHGQAGVFKDQLVINKGVN